tara:strand:+ start:1210 stop:1701 length:492 start_codon:yes stop_codon:yes gene_type:complete
MKKNTIFIFLCVAMAFSCSNDKLAADDSLSIIGEWKFTGIDANEATGNVKLTCDILTVLVAGGCNILTFDFKNDLTVTSLYKDFTQTGKDVNVSGTGLLIECPESVITETTVWELEGNQLSFIDANGAVEIITVQIEGDVMIIPGEVLDEDNLKGTEAVFEKQ